MWGAHVLVGGTFVLGGACVIVCVGGTCVLGVFSAAPLPFKALSSDFPSTPYSTTNHFHSLPRLLAATGWSLLPAPTSCHPALPPTARLRCTHAGTSSSATRQRVRVRGGVQGGGSVCGEVFRGGGYLLAERCSWEGEGACMGVHMGGGGGMQSGVLGRGRVCAGERSECGGR